MAGRYVWKLWGKLVGSETSGTGLIETSFTGLIETSYTGLIETSFKMNVGTFRVRFVVPDLF